MHFGVESAFRKRSKATSWRRFARVMTIFRAPLCSLGSRLVYESRMSDSPPANWRRVLPIAALPALSALAPWLASPFLLLPLLLADHRFAAQWHTWKDQSYYLQSAAAWSHLNLDPAQHHYPSGYSLLAAPFVWLSPTNPFTVPNLLCATATLFLFVALCRRMAPDWPLAAPAAAISFLAATVWNHHTLPLWAVPWTTTAEAPLILLSLLAALRFAATNEARTLATIGAAAGLGLAVRPSDALLILAVCAAYCAILLLAQRPPPRTILRCAIAGPGGFLLGALPVALIHAAVYGFAANPAAARSAAIGFEWQLIPFRWVTLALSPQPLFPTGTAIASVLPWFFLGCAGMIRAATSRTASRHALAIAAVTAYWAVYLSYRALNAPSLWQFNLIHYFKWTFPFLVFWAVLLLSALGQAEARRGALAALAACCLAFAWRPALNQAYPTTEPTQRGTAVIPGGLSPITRLAFIQTTSTIATSSSTNATLKIGGATFHDTFDFALFPRPDGILITPLRPLPAGDATLALNGSGTFPSPVQVTTAQWSLALGLPCFILPRRPVCTALPHLAPRVTP
jgi:hypothetical protein